MTPASLEHKPPFAEEIRSATWIVRREPLCHFREGEPLIEARLAVADDENEP